MSIENLINDNRKEEFIAVCKYIKTCDSQTLALIIEEIRCVHDNILIFNPNIKSLDRVESVSINGECIQLNIALDIEID